MGALQGVRVIEMAGLAPAPFCGMILADFGADVVRVDRVGGGAFDQLARGKRSVAVNPKHPDGLRTLLSMLDQADVLLEPFRPGVTERLGLGPDVVCARNPRLIYARLTGFGQDGPYRDMAGHDINYIALSGALSLIGRRGERPVAPVNLLGDFAGGGMLCALGIVLALVERSRSHQGQIVDAAMVDGAAYLSSFLYNFRNAKMWSDERGTNMLDGGAPFYETYETKDGHYMSVGAIEPQFYAALLQGLDLDATAMPHQHDRSQWPSTAARFTEIFKSKTRAEWCTIFDGTDACVAPVLGLGEVNDHPHTHARRVLREAPTGGLQAAPAPRLSRTPGSDPRPSPLPGQHTTEVLREYGFSTGDVERLSAAGAVQQA